MGIHATKRKLCTGVHEGPSTTAVQRFSSVAVCHLVSTLASYPGHVGGGKSALFPPPTWPGYEAMSTPLNISKLSGNAKKVK